jgi:hypothetical protein
VGLRSYVSDGRDRVKRVNTLPCVLPALGNHTVNNGVREAIYVLGLVDDDGTKWEQKRCTVTVSLLEALEDEEDVLLDGEFHFGLCPKPWLGACGYQYNTLKAPERVYIAKCMYGRSKTEGRPELHERLRSQC